MNVASAHLDEMEWRNLVRDAKDDAAHSGKGKKEAERSDEEPAARPVRDALAQNVPQKPAMENNQQRRRARECEQEDEPGKCHAPLNIIRELGRHSALAGLIRRGHRDSRARLSHIERGLACEPLQSGGDGERICGAREKRLWLLRIALKAILDTLLNLGERLLRSRKIARLEILTKLAKLLFDRDTGLRRRLARARLGDVCKDGLRAREIAGLDVLAELLEVLFELLELVWAVLRRLSVGNAACGNCGY
jgi:hypothetical protein